MNGLCGIEWGCSAFSGLETVWSTCSQGVELGWFVAAPSGPMK